MDDLVIRVATKADVPALVAIFAADSVGGHGDTDDPAEMPRYLAAFETISASPNDTLYVAEFLGAVVGTFQTTEITTLTGRGSSSFTIEAVQTREDMRGRGIGAAMVRFAVAEAERRGARLVQLMSNSKREDAHRFYRRLGFAQSHAGFKMKLRDAG
jgi:GNAT superfamily N-acetyltransferase